MTNELTTWLADTFEAIAAGSIWPDDLSPRSQNNGFNWDVRQEAVLSLAQARKAKAAAAAREQYLKKRARMMEARG
jgi:hypothetical protein